MVICQCSNDPSALLRSPTGLLTYDTADDLHLLLADTRPSCLANNLDTNQD